MTRYIETPADHAMTAFLAGMTPGRAFKDRQANFTKVERKRQRFLREKTNTETRHRLGHMFTAEQIAITQRVLAAQKAS